jgi:RND family efflux transporter MFP subunit
MKKNFLIFGLVCILALFNSCSENNKTADKLHAKRLRPVKVVEALVLKNGCVKIFSGTTRSSFTSKLSFRVPGTILTLNVDTGDNVSSGQLIASLDPTDYELKVEEVVASLERAKAQWRNAEATYARVLALYERGNASLGELDETRAASSSAQAVVKSVGKQVELVKRNLEYTKLFSPKDCNIASVHAEENENVQAGQPIAVLNCGNSIEVHIQVPASFVFSVKKGESALVEIDSINNKKFEGIIKEVGSSPNALNTTYPVIISILENSMLIKPGMSALVKIESKPKVENNYPAVIPVCVGEDSKGKFVWKVETSDFKEGRVKKAYIEIGGFSGSKIIVTKGLLPGELIVSAGVSQVREGIKVRIEKEI